MSVIVRPRRRPVNRLILAGLAASGTVWELWPTSDSAWQTVACAGMAALVAVVCLVRALRELIEDYRLRAAYAASQHVTDDYGSARQANWREIVGAGMNHPASGNYLGLFQGTAPVFAPPRTPFSLIEMPPGAGKTVNCVIGSILHRARLGASIVVADPKLELGVMLGPQLRAQGYEVWFANPTHGFEALCGDIELNPYQSLIDSTHAPDGRRHDAPKYAADIAEQHYPTDKSERNPYFSHGSRRTILTASLYLALVDPGHCTPTDVYRLLADPRRIRGTLGKVRDSLEGRRKDDPLIDFLRGEAANLLDRAEHNEENFGAFLEGATQRLLPFNQAGRVAHYGRAAIRNIAELRERQVILFIMTPLSHLRDLGAFISLLNHTIIEACKTSPTGRPLHIVAEEALNYQFTNLVSDLETLRGLGVTADFYIQSFHGLIRRYGREAAMAIEAYADVKMYAGLNSFDRARFVSEMLAEETIRKQDYSYQTVLQSFGVSSRELGRRLMMPNEILAMPRHLAWTFVRGMNPMLLDMTHYGAVAPWRDWVGANPIEGPALRAAPRFTIHYPERKATDV